MVIFHYKEEQQMEVFKRLSSEQIEKLIELEKQRIIEITGETSLETNEFVTDLDFNELEGEFYLWERQLCIHCIFVHVCGVDSIFADWGGKTNLTWAELQMLDKQIERVFLKYMYSIFGDEYKKEYLERFAEIFEEEEE